MVEQRGHLGGANIMVGRSRRVFKQVMENQRSGEEVVSSWELRAVFLVIIVIVACGCVWVLGGVPHVVSSM